jgi:hypothetical protein
VNPSLGAWASTTAVSRSAFAGFFLHVIGLPPYTIEVGFPLFPVETISRRIAFSRLQPFRYVQAPKFARLPDRSYRCDLSSQGSRGFYVRAEHASLPPHASDMLTTRCELKSRGNDCLKRGANCQTCCPISTTLEGRAARQRPVLEPFDNESHSRKAGAEVARHRCICQHQRGEGPGRIAR